jgi:hypothetical protein
MLGTDYLQYQTYKWGCYDTATARFYGRTHRETPVFLDDWLRLLYFNSPPLLPPDISSFVTALRLAPWSSRMSNALAQNELLFSNRAYFAAELLNAFALGEYHRPRQR